jgi:phosphoadenosine phosphosulfate reductase
LGESGGGGVTLLDNTLFGEVDKVAIAIQRLKTFEPSEGYYLAFSGGKDSITIKALADMAEVKYDAHYNLTTVDPPELVYFIKREHEDVKIERPKTTIWQLIPKKLMPPTRMVRYCCDVLKEQGGSERIIITGVRQQESVKRNKRKMVEQCSRDKHKTFVNPIIDWSDAEVWEFIKQYNVPYCSLYDEGFTRLGCIGCPMAGPKQQQKELERWPKYRDAYIKSFERMIKERKRRGKPVIWKTGEEVMSWWLREAKSDQEDDQTVLFE